MTKCQHCTPPQGLPILPIRYAIAPKEKGDSPLLPKWAESTQTAMIAQKLSDQSQLALRVMGKGYLYVLLKISGDDELVWQVYSVDENGGFWRQHNVEKYGIASVSDSDALIGCDAGDHKSGDVAFITIEQPEQCETAWLAFSRFKWTEEICQEYSDINNAQIRDERMQKIEPAKWLQTQREMNGVASASDDNVQKVLGYQLPEDENNYRLKKFTFFDTTASTESKNQGPLSSSVEKDVFLVDMVKFRRRSTCHNWNQVFEKCDGEQNPITLSTVIQSAKVNDSIVPMMVGLWDSISMVEELKLWINQAFSHVQQVEFEREREINLTNTFQFIGKAIESGAALNYSKQLDKRFINRVKAVNGEALNELDKYNIPIGKMGGAGISYAQSWLNIFNADQIKLLNSMRANVTHALEEKLITEQNLTSIKESDKDTITEDYRYNFTLELKRQQQPESITYLQYEASYLYQWASRNIQNSEAFLAPYNKTLFAPIMQLQSNVEANFTVLNREFDLFKAKALAQGEADEPIFAGLKLAKQQEEWQKYAQHISEERVQQFNTAYARYQKNANDYIALLVNDFTIMVDGRESNQHPFYYANQEYLNCSADYLAFIDDILVTLNSEITIIRAAKSKTINTKQNQQPTQQTTSQQDYSAADLAIINDYKDKEALVYQLIRRPNLETSNLFWAAILAGKSLTKEQQLNVMDYMIASFYENDYDIDENYRNSLISHISELFNIPQIGFDEKPLENCKTLVQQTVKEQEVQISQNEVKDGTIDAKDTSFDTVIDKTKEIAEKSVDFYQSTAEYKPTSTVVNTPPMKTEALFNLLKVGQETLSGFFTSITNYLHDRQYTFNSRCGNALYSAVCFGMKVSANVIKTIAGAMIEFSDELLKAINKKIKLAAEIISGAYEKLSARLESSYKLNNFKMPITRCLLGFQLFSIYRTWQSATSKTDTPMTTSEVTALWSGIMSAVMLTTKSFKCSAFMTKMVDKIKTKAFGAPLSQTAKFKLLRHGTAGIMRIGNLFGAIGSLFGAFSQLNEKHYSSGGTIMKYVNAFNSLLLSIDFVCQALVKQTLSKLLLGLAERSAICFVLGRLVAFMLHPLVGLAIFIVTTIISLVSDDPLQSWFKSNRLGRNYYIWDNKRTFGYTMSNYSSSYSSYQDELNDLHEILDTDEYKAEHKKELAAKRSKANRMTLIRG